MSNPTLPELTAIQQKSNVTYVFPNLEKDGHEAAITLSENRSMIGFGATTGLRTWDAAVFLSTYLAGDGEQLIRAKRVLELGAGTGLVSLLCTKYLGAEYVMATDGSQDVVSALEDNLFRNNLDHGIAIKCRVLRWGRPVEVGEDGAGKGFDIVIGADIVRFLAKNARPGC
jgi:predicted nicotinamide N-methyase